jgi:hypothetical protein
MKRSESRDADKSTTTRGIKHLGSHKFKPTSTTRRIIANRLALGALAAALACVALSFVVVAKSHRAANVSDTEAKAVGAENRVAAIIPAVQSAGRPRKIETEIITLRSEGFEPPSITRPQGLFILLLDNRSGLSEVQLDLDRQAGNRITQVNVPREKLDWSEGFDLPPGRYLLTEAIHPEWSCTITITPK